MAIAPPHAAQRSMPPVSSQKRRPQLETFSLSLMASDFRPFFGFVRGCPVAATLTTASLAEALDRA